MTDTLAPMAAPAVTVGTVIADKYRVERVLGVGGMGMVVAAQHLILDQLVALKFMLPQTMSEPGLVDRFLREAKAAVKLRSEHVAKVLDVGTLANGTPYIVIEYLEGGDLSDLLDQRGTLPLDEALEYILQACVGMAEAHSHGIIHRDLKPENLFLTRRPDGRPLVKILDFGISKAMGSDGFSETRTNQIMGSPAYMSPEQMKSSRDVDARTDIWALGAILYHLLDGRPPFDADSFPELCVRVLSDTPRLFDPAVLGIPDELKAVVFRCLEKQPGHRPASVAALVAGLAKFHPRGDEMLERVCALLGADPATVAIAPRAPTAEVLAAAASAARAAATELDEDEPVGTVGRRRWPVLAVGAGLLAVAAAVVATGLGRGAEPAAPSAAEARAPASPGGPPSAPAGAEPGALVPDTTPPSAVAAPADEAAAEGGEGAAAASADQTGADVAGAGATAADGTGADEAGGGATAAGRTGADQTGADQAGEGEPERARRARRDRRHKREPAAAAPERAGEPAAAPAPPHPAERPSRSRDKAWGETFNPLDE